MTSHQLTCNSLITLHSLKVVKVNRSTVSHFFALNCNVQHCIALQCVVLNFIDSLHSKIKNCYRHYQKVRIEHCFSLFSDVLETREDEDRLLIGNEWPSLISLATLCEA